MPTRPIREVIQNRKPIVAAPTLTVREAARLMAAERVGALLVVEADHLVGIFTERDALVRVLAEGRNADRTTLTEVMTRDPRTIRSDRPLGHALHIMYDGGFRHMPVVDDGRAVGMVSVRDALGPELIEFEHELGRRDSLMERMG